MPGAQLLRFPRPGVDLEALRRLGPIDQALQERVQKPPPDRVVQILRLGAAQLFVLKTPAHAAVGATVERMVDRKAA